MPDATLGDALALPDLAAMRSAQARIAPYVHRTPVLSCQALDDEAGASLYFKCENFQKVGAFKARGATNAVFALLESAARHGVVTHSSGNHGAAIAYAARARGIPAWIVMPDNAPRVKQENVRRFGATIRFAHRRRCARGGMRGSPAWTGATLIHPFDDAGVIAGQGPRRSSSSKRCPISISSLRRWAAADCCRGRALPCARCDPRSVSTAPNPLTPMTRHGAIVRVVSSRCPRP
jgi:threonine dehydratase